MWEGTVLTFFPQPLSLVSTAQQRGSYLCSLGLSPGTIKLHCHGRPHLCLEDWVLAQSPMEGQHGIPSKRKENLVHFLISPPLVTFKLAAAYEIEQRWLFRYVPLCLQLLHNEIFFCLFLNNQVFYVETPRFYCSSIKLIEALCFDEKGPQRLPHNM